MMSRTSVLFPQPESPTTPSAVPAARSNVTLLTAVMGSLLGISNTLVRPRTDKMGIILRSSVVEVLLQ